ncbi:MAG: hypothetical protein IJU58_02585, partial [Clostridia bacterium]|nr:hypothetical protein [Clostridia bacterium]
TRENIVRLQDIYREVENRIGPLREQAETAKKYLSLRDELKSYEINNYIYCYDNAESNKNEIKTQIMGIEEQVALKANQVQEATDKTNKSLEGIKSIDAQIQQLHDKAIELSVSLQKKKGDVELAQTKMDYMRRESEKLQQELKDQKAEFEALSKDLQDKQEEKHKKIQNLADLRTKVDEVQKVYVQIVSQLNKNEDLVSRSHKDLNDKLNKISNIKAEISSINTEIRSLQDRQNDINNQLADVTQKLNLAKKQENDAKLTKDEVEARKKTLNQELEALKENLIVIQKEQRDLNITIHDLENKLYSCKERSNMLKEMQTEYEGYSGTVRKLLVDAGKNPALKAQVVGVVGELIKVPQNLETAIEMALGSNVQNIVTNDEQQAKKLVAYLKTQNYGRATFLPISSIKPRFIGQNFESLLKSKGVLGVAANLIDCDSKITPIIKGLLGNTVVVDNMDTAVKLANDSRFGFKIVTLDGDIINPAGSITGGSKKTALNNILSRDREIKDIAENITKLEQDLSNKRLQLEKYDAMVINLTKQTTQHTEKLHVCEVEFAQKDEMYKYASENSENYNQELKALKEEYTRLGTKVELLQTKLDATKQQDDSVVLGDGQSSGGNQFDALRAQRDKLSDQLTEYKVSIASLEGEISAIDAEIERLIAGQERLNEEMDETSSMLV